jgi:DNA processing protein
MLRIDIEHISSVKETIAHQMDPLLSRPDVTAITVLDDEYPESLHALGNQKPLVLYVRGDSSLLDAPGIAVIGTRKPSAHTERIEPGLVKNIIEFTGDTIISGLAAGCDSIAHASAVKYHGKTLAVLPSGIDKIYPSVNKDLAENIVKSGGCLVSEYGMDRATNRFTFVERDGVIAALSHTVIAVECGVNSGTKETVKKAVQMKKKVRCYMPKDMKAGNFSGNEYMVKELGAVAVTCTSSLKRVLEEEM